MSRILLILVATIALMDCPTARGVTIDFESIASGTVVKDQFLSLGLRIDGSLPGGRVISIGTFGVTDIGGSGTQVLDVGETSVNTFFRFVDPEDPLRPLAVEQFSMLVGNGGGIRDAGFQIDLFPMRSDLQYTETGIRVKKGTPGEWFVSPAGRWKGFAVRSRITDDPRSVMDDLTYTQLPEPGTATMAIALIGCIGAWGFVRRR